MRTRPEDLQMVSMILLFLISALVWASLFALVVVTGILDRKWLREHWKTGLSTGIALFLMMLPMQVLVFFYVIPGMVGMGEDEGHASIWFYVVLTVGALIFLIKPAWYMIVYHAAVSQWRRLKDEAMPLLRRRSYRPWPAVVAGAAFGVAAGGLTLLIFLRRGVESAVHLQRFAQHAPGFEEIGPWVRLPIVALAVSALAIAEELYFRGVLLGALLRWWGRSRSAIVAAAISNSFLWGLLHLANTNQPLLKFGQIFLVGLVLSEMTRRWCFESAVAGHVAMNVTAVAAGFLLSGA